MPRVLAEHRRGGAWGQWGAVPSGGEGRQAQRERASAAGASRGRFPENAGRRMLALPSSFRDAHSDKLAGEERVFTETQR